MSKLAMSKRELQLLAIIEALLNQPRECQHENSGSRWYTDGSGFRIKEVVCIDCRKRLWATRV